ncbi:hypothetical protein A2685_01075 [Candidatus Woesebacteria bacterium RIFCSPHIGHO2_01_FULL_37_10]|uniref:Uncharacterized protein n=1 Tax=Candidatus Woesebacteria bacterium RIFCSPHIGHO2_01_FULL_37_10 TaxID=1802489 RepID=A0A1F7XU34_9BACT|nr:MAG: hypothetical protein A2685_01075 [Candidatus Woesebacteria bacterium RIFCSPHIGHO2_01_FULL_37_10]
MCYNTITINNKLTEDLIRIFFKKGGRINKHYLSTPIMKGPSLVYLNGWFGGQNLRVAILKALGQK